MLKDFKDTFIRQSSVDFLVALIVGNKLVSTIDSLLSDVIAPLVSYYIYNLSDFSFGIHVSGLDVEFGGVISNITSFLVSMAIVFFFIVKPFRALLDEGTKRDNEKQNQAIKSLTNIEKMLSHSSQALRL